VQEFVANITKEYKSERKLQCLIYTTIKITSEFKNVSATVGVVDGLALHGKQT